MNKLLITIIVLLFTLPSIGQKVVLERKVDSAYVQSAFGANQSYFIHGFVGALGNITTNSDQELDVIPFLSNKYQLGIRFKKKITRNHRHELNH